MDLEHLEFKLNIKELKIKLTTVVQKATTFPIKASFLFEDENTLSFFTTFTLDVEKMLRLLPSDARHLFYKEPTGYFLSCIWSHIVFPSAPSEFFNFLQSTEISNDACLKQITVSFKFTMDNIEEFSTMVERASRSLYDSNFNSNLEQVLNNER